MNKLDLIQTLKTKAGISKTEAATVVRLFFGEMADALANGDRVEIRGLCSFYVKKYKSYTGRNPKILDVKPKKGKRLLVTFNNGIKKIYDCSSLIDDDIFKPLMNDALFNSVQADKYPGPEDQVFRV